MRDGEAWTVYVDQYSREMYLAQDALLSHPSGRAFVVLDGDFMSNIDPACLDRLAGTFVSFEGESV